MMPSLADDARLIAKSVPNATPDEVLMITRCRSAIRKIDRRGPRGVETVTQSEIEAMAVMLAICGGPILSSAADHGLEGR